MARKTVPIFQNRILYPGLNNLSNNLIFESYLDLEQIEITVSSDNIPISKERQQLLSNCLL